MTQPEEKAKELISKYCNYLYPLSNAGYKQGKQCALICVDEILLHEKNSHSVLDKSTDYWREVKTKIENL